MPLRLSRLSFWLAAPVAVFALFAPGRNGSLPAALGGVAGLLAFVLAWVANREGAPETVTPAGPPPARVPGEAALLETAAQLLRRANASATFESALPGVAQLLRSERDRGNLPAEAMPGVAQSAQSVPTNVLIIEDNVVQPEVTARMLRRAGCRVSVASGMLDGLNALRRTQFSLILIDVQLLGADAAEGLRRLRARPDAASDAASVSDVCVIALSGPNLPGDRERFRELGFDDHLSRPIRQREVLAMLSKPLRPPDPAASKDTAVPLHGGAAHAPAGDESVLDRTALARLAELDPKGENRLLERVLQAFQGSVARLRPQLDAARRSADRSAIRLVVHTLKSSSASIGALRLSQLCSQIESAIRLETETDLHAPLDDLDAALDRALQAIGALLKERA